MEGSLYQVAQSSINSFLSVDPSFFCVMSTRAPVD